MSNLSQLYEQMERRNNSARFGSRSRIANFADIKIDPNAYTTGSTNVKASLRPGFTGGMKQAGAGLGEAASYTAQKTKQLIMATSRTGKKFFREGWKLAGGVASAAGNAAKSVGNAAMKNPGKTAAIGAGVAAVGAGGYYLANRDN